MLRQIIWYIYFVLYLIGTLPVLLYVNLLKRAGKTTKLDAITFMIVKHWAKSLVHLAGGSINVTGTENLPEDTVVFVGNHQGNFDIPLFLGFIDKPKGFVAKIEMLKIPIVRSWMKHLNCVFMDRANIRQSVGVINEAVKLLKHGKSMIIFPEGTRSKGNHIGPFKAGSLKLAVKAGVPIVPIVLDGSFKLMEEYKRIRPATVGIHICPPISTINLTKEEISNLPERVRFIIEAKLKDK